MTQEFANQIELKYKRNAEQIRSYNMTIVSTYEEVTLKTK